MTATKNPQDLIEFPCHYQFKAVGLAGEEFRAGVLAAVSRLVNVPGDAVKTRQSGNGNYQSVSVVVTLHNFEQLKKIYAGLRQVPGMKMLL